MDVDAADHLLIDETADGEAIEHLAELLPELAVVAALALIIDVVNAASDLLVDETADGEAIDHLVSLLL